MKYTYDITQSYDWNYENGPLFIGEKPQRPPLKKEDQIDLFGFKINAPLGVPAGPLLNSNWIKLYAELGWDIPVYKTVRTLVRECHPNPNCIYVNMDHQLTAKDSGGKVISTEKAPRSPQELTITNSFGMPSKAPKIWMRDVEKANSYMEEGQVMVISVVGTPGVGKSLSADYAQCAAMAKEAGAKIIEANYSCPNVCSGEGSIFTDPELSSEISQKIRAAIGNTPFMIKMGNCPTVQILEEVIKANAPYIDGVAGINTVAMKVYNGAGEQALPGEGRLTSGLCGAAIHDVSMDFVRNVSAIRKKHKPDLVICGVGGVMTVENIDERLNAGANIVMSATGAMWDPMMAMQYHNKINN